MTIHLPLLTNSQTKTGRRCLAEHHFDYDLGYRPVSKAEALRFGNLIHLGLEAYFRAPEARFEAALAAMQPHATDAFDWVRASVLLQGYDARWGAEELEVLAVEQEFRAPLINPDTGAASRTWRLAGKIDVIVRNLHDGLVYVVEHKTSSDDTSPGSIYWQLLRIDSQVSIYYSAAKVLGYDVAGVIYDVIGKPGIKPLKATPVESRQYKKDGSIYAKQREQDETPEQFRERLVEKIAENPDRYYSRGTVVRLEEEEKNAAFDVWCTAKTIREAQLTGRYPRNPDACRRYNRVCGFLPVCTGESSLEDESLYVRRDHIHSELSAEEAAE